MDAFRILGKGAKFDLDRFKDDAEHIDVCMYYNY